MKDFERYLQKLGISTSRPDGEGGCPTCGPDYVEVVEWEELLKAMDAFSEEFKNKEKK